jgi:hypothetical protein
MAAESVKLFLSCVSAEFGHYRDALRHALTLPNVEVKIQEDFKGSGRDTLRTVADYVESCETVDRRKRQPKTPKRFRWSAAAAIMTSPATVVAACPFRIRARKS